MYARNTQPVHPQHPVHLQQNTRNSPQEELEEAAFASKDATPMLGSVPIHQPHPMQAIATLRLGQSRKISLRIFLEAPGHLDYFDPLTTNQVILICLYILTSLR